MKRVVVIAAIVAMSVAVAAGSGRASAPSRIVFTADRAPSLSGEIYRLDPNGERVDLSSSPFQDSGPVVSPDGERVAFFSDRSGMSSVWEVGIDGGRAVQVGPGLGSGALAWQPHGRRLAVLADQGVFIVQPGHRPLPVLASSARRELLVPAWSPDGKILVVWDGPAFSPTGTPGVLRAFSPGGRPLWSVPGPLSPSLSAWSWSRRGLLALSFALPPLYIPAVRVYDERGRLRFRVNGFREKNVEITDELGRGPEWSPDGREIALYLDGKLEVVTSAGRRILRRRVGSPRCSDIVWASDTGVLLGGLPPYSGCHVTSLDLRSGRVSRASSRWFGTRSANGELEAVASQSGVRIAIGVAPTAGGPTRTYAHVSACTRRLRPAPVASLQFAGPTRSLVYASYCPDPYTNLYSVAPDGSGLQQLTTETYAAQPALSPDGTQIAYTYGIASSSEEAIWILGSGGAKSRLTTPPMTCIVNLPTGPVSETFDSQPSWSPDGTTILFVRTFNPNHGCFDIGELNAIPATGGSPKDLGVAGQSPAWGPTRIAYTANGIWTANPDGSDAVQIATDGSNPAWSTDGRLAYLTGSNGTTVVVGSTTTQLPFAAVTSLAWSPDGTRFAVTARTTPTGPLDVYTINMDGSSPVQLTHDYNAQTVSWR
ncbi:MAG TPA: hypothetical protein VKR79_00235 [Gaiellaceae bacterium]|nr:hypothetical protein [Gaiellaceae bacterium]